MSTDFDRFCLIVSFENPTSVVLSTCMGVGGWRCPSSSRVVHIRMASLAFRKVVPFSDSSTEKMTVLMSWHRLWMVPSLVEGVGGLLPFLTS